MIEWHLAGTEWGVGVTEIINQPMNEWINQSIDQWINESMIEWHGAGTEGGVGVSTKRLFAAYSPLMLPSHAPLLTPWSSPNFFVMLTLHHQCYGHKMSPVVTKWHSSPERPCNNDYYYYLCHLPASVCWFDCFFVLLHIKATDWISLKLSPKIAGAQYPIPDTIGRSYTDTDTGLYNIYFTENAILCGV